MAPETIVVVIVVMGPAGAGKTTVGRALAAALRWPFHDADDYHAAENVARMRRGEALTDADRAPWLATLRALVADELARDGAGAVLACSALRRAYRDALVPADASPGAVQFVFLDVSPSVLHERLAARAGHYASESLLASQLATLEAPRPDEGAIVVDGERPVAELVARLRERLAPNA